MCEVGASTDRIVASKVDVYACAGLSVDVGLDQLHDLGADAIQHIVFESFSGSSAPSQVNSSQKL